MVIKNRRRRRLNFPSGKTIRIDDFVFHRKTGKLVRVVEIVNSRGMEVDFIDPVADPDGRVEFPIEFGQKSGELWAYCDEVSFREDTPQS